MDIGVSVSLSSSPILSYTPPDTGGGATESLPNNGTEEYIISMVLCDVNFIYFISMICTLLAMIILLIAVLW